MVSRIIAAVSVALLAAGVGAIVVVHASTTTTSLLNESTVTAAQSFPANQTTTPSVVVSCPTGDTLVGGGYTTDAPGEVNLTLQVDGPTSSNTWEVSGKNPQDYGFSFNLTAYAFCIGSAT